MIFNFAKYTPLLLIPMIAKLAGIFKVSFIIGSQTAFFSASNMVGPLTGFYTGVAGSFIALLYGISMRLLTGSWAIHTLAYHIPGFCASLALANPSRITHILLPTLCMALFLAHPEGFYAFGYTFFWFIPMALFILKKDSFFSQALAATFIAHAVGSVIWIWTVPMATAQWYALIPIVILERTAFALGMTVCYLIIERIRLSSFVFLRNLAQ